MELQRSQLLLSDCGRARNSRKYIFLLFAVLSVVLTILAIRRVKNVCDDARICYFSLYIQIMILAYSVTGNPTYSRQIMFIWFFSIGAVLHIARKHNIDIVINKESERRHL